MRGTYTLHTELLLPLIVGMWAIGMALFGYYMVHVRRYKSMPKELRRGK